MLTRPSWLTDAVLVAVAFGLLIAMAIGWLSYDREPAQGVGATVIARPSGEVAKVPVKTVTPKAGVKVYRGGAALKDGLKLPRDAVEDPDVEVLASSHVKADDHPHTVTTVIDTETGESTTYDRRDPLPWMAWSERGHAGVAVGLKSGEPTARLQVEQEIVTVKALRLSGIATVDQPLNAGATGGDFFAGVMVKYQW